MTIGLKTYVQFIRPSKASHNGVATVRQVEGRDIAKLQIPAGADFFYFFDSNIIQGARQDRSALHIIAEKLLTRDEVKEMLADRSQWAHIGWDKKLEQNDLFALTRNGNIEVVEKGSIVLDAQKKQLWPELPPPAPEKPFRMMTDRKVAVKKHPASFTPKP